MFDYIPLVISEEWRSCRRESTAHELTSILSTNISTMAGVEEKGPENIYGGGPTTPSLLAND